MIRTGLISLCLSFSVSALWVPAGAQTLQLGGAEARVSAAEGSRADVFARRLGKISALVRHEDGTLYAADRKSGQIFRMIDRGLDGVADVTQPLPHRFDGPSGLALLGDTLFVADRRAVWRLAPGRMPEQLASLSRSNTRGEAHPLAMVDGTTLRLGLSRTDGTAQLLDIDTETGVATLHEAGAGRIVGFASLALSDPDTPLSLAPWALIDTLDGLVIGPSYSRALPLEGEVHALWIDPVKGEAKLATATGVMNAQATLAGIQAEPIPLLNGLVAGVMVSDTRGLFVADPDHGRLWRVSETVEASPVEVPAPLETDIAVAKPIPKAPTLLRGSAIGRASDLPEADPPQSSASPDE